MNCKSFSLTLEWVNEQTVAWASDICLAEPQNVSCVHFQQLISNLSWQNVTGLNVNGLLRLTIYLCRTDMSSTREDLSKICTPPNKMEILFSEICLQQHYRHNIRKTSLLLILLLTQKKNMNIIHSVKIFIFNLKALATTLNYIFPKLL